MGIFSPASRAQLKARIALVGPSGSGKTFTALRWAIALARGGRVCVIDTEHYSASKYVGMAPDGVAWQFDVANLMSFAPRTYIAALDEAVRMRPAVVVVDSLSHAWTGKGGALEMVDAAGGNKFTSGWAKVTPECNALVEKILALPCHVIATMRTKTEYAVIEENGKAVPKKIGVKPVQRDGVDYEFDVVCSMALDHTLSVDKTRCSALDGQVASLPGPAFLDPLVGWLSEGEPAGATDAGAGAQGQSAGQGNKADRPAEPGDQQVSVGSQDSAETQGAREKADVAPGPEAFREPENGPLPHWQQQKIKQLCKTHRVGLDALQQCIGELQPGATKLAQLTVAQGDQLLAWAEGQGEIPF